MQLARPFRDGATASGSASPTAATAPPALRSAGRRPPGVPPAPAPHASSNNPAATLPPIVFVRRRRARRYVLRVDVDGCVRVTIPRGGSRREAADVVARHEAWIAERRARVRSIEVLEDARRALQARARAELPARLLALAQQHGLTVVRVSVRDQRSRWGSCGPNGHICLNWRLVTLPDWVRDYVLIHELMHLRRLDHSAAYWALVGRACPEYRAARRWLRDHGMHDGGR